MHDYSIRKGRVHAAPAGIRDRIDRHGHANAFYYNFLVASGPLSSAVTGSAAWRSRWPVACLRLLGWTRRADTVTQLSVRGVGFCAFLAVGPSPFSFLSVLAFFFRLCYFSAD